MRAFLKIASLLAALVPAVVRADPLVLIDPAHAVDDVTDSLTPVLEPQALGEDKVAPPVARMIKNDYAYSGWLSVSIKNAGTVPIDRILVFTHPTLSRSSITGAPLAAPRLINLRYAEGDSPVALPLSGPANRFASLGVHLEPGATETLVLNVENGSQAISVHAWDPRALARFDTYLLLAIGLYWGILFVGVALLFALRILTRSAGLVPGAFFVLAALVFEGSSFGFGGGGWSAALGRIGLDPSAVLRPVSLILAAFFGVQFLRRLFALREEVPLLDVGLRLFQYALLVALPLVFVWGVGPVAARGAALSALVVSGLAIFFMRRSIPETLTLIAPGWFALCLAAIGALAVSGFGWHAGGSIAELLLHGMFVIGVTLLVFAAAVRSGGNFAAALMPAAQGAAYVPERREALPLAPTSAAGASFQGLWDWTIAENRLYVSPSVEAMLGLPEGALDGRERGWTQRIVEEDRAAYSDALRHYIDQGNSSFTLEFRLRHSDGTLRWAQLRATGIAGEDGRAQRMIGVVTDITSAKAAEEELVREASHDSLTGAGNRAFMLAQIDYALAGFLDAPAIDARTGRKLPPAVLLLDIDRFKTINDELGHAAGDELLIHIARRIAESLGPDDALARYGNDEFAILLTPSAQADSPEEMASLLHDVCAQPVELAGRTVHPSITIGVLRFDERHASAQEIMSEAETALRLAKKRGSGGTEAFTERRSERRPPATSLEADLRQAMQRDELFVLYQPIMSLKTGGVAGFESLLRWRHPQRGILGPETFIPLAEETGMIVTLGRVALSMAAMQLGQWQTYFPLRRALFITVNVSSRQLLRSDFVRDVTNVLNTVELAPGSLKLEVTESLVFDDEARVVQLFAALKAKGVSLALDDYGKGQSTLARLKALPLSTIKIDRDYVEGAGDGAQADAILRSTIAMAHDMKLDVVCEGVERAEQVGALKALGADFVQGYLFGEPMPALEAQRFIAQHWKPETPKAKTA